MSLLAIEDIDFCETELTHCHQTIGGVYIPKSWDWGAAFSFDFDSDGISSFSLGHLSAYAIAIGPIIISSGNPSR